MPWSRLGRLWSYPRRNLTARSRWEYIGRDRRDAYQMMDGSTCEEDLRRRGGRMALALGRALDIRPSHRLLDVGCGVARLGRELAPLCGAYTGADISRSLLRWARERTTHLGNISLVYLDPTQPALEGLPEQRFQRLICHLVFLHLDVHEIRALLRGFHRVLTLDGVAYLDAWNLRHPDVWDLFRRESMNPNIRRQPHRSRFYTREDVEDWLDTCGLSPLWMRDDSFLTQAVVARGDADKTAQRRMAAHLEEAGKVLVPQGRLDFIPHQGRTGTAG